MKRFYLASVIFGIFTLSQVSHAEDKIKLETIVIKGNKELPKILYIVPWQKGKNSKKQEQHMVLHSLFGDLFDPMMPDTGLATSTK